MKKQGAFKYKFIRKYEVDFWGYLISCTTGKRFFKKMFKMFCFKNKYKVRLITYLYNKPYIKFNYARDMPMKKIRKSYTKDYIVQLHDLLKYRVYYGDMTIKKFRRYLQIVNTRRLDFESKLYFLLESRLDILLFRLNLVKNPKEARQYIKCKKVKVNDKIVSKLNNQLYLHDVISLDSKLSIAFFENLRLNLKNKKILFNYPKYIEVSYDLMKFMFISYPKNALIPYISTLNFSYLRTFI